MNRILRAVFGPGFFSNGPVHVALVVGGVTAVVSGVVGVFTVIRGQSFAGHALSDVGSTGGSGAALLGAGSGAGSLWGFVVGCVAGAGTMELLGIRRPRGRDLATGIVLGGALGLSALFLYLETTRGSTTGVTITVLFGSMFTIDGSTVVPVVLLSAAVLALVLLLFRPLLLSSLSPEMAIARGVPVRLVGLAFLGSMAMAVALSSVAVGAILSTALLIGPAAAALRVTRRPLPAMLAAALIGLGATWIGIVLSYDSYSWPPVQHGWPVSFFVVALVFTAYLLSGLPGFFRRRQLERQSGRGLAGPGCDVSTGDVP